MNIKLLDVFKNIAVLILLTLFSYACQQDLLQQGNLNEKDKLINKVNFGNLKNTDDLLYSFQLIEEKLPSIDLRNMPIQENVYLKFKDMKHFLEFYNEL